MVALSGIDGPCLLSWAIVRVTPTKYPQHSLFQFTGIGFGHPRLPDGVQFLTTSIQEIAEDCTWGRTRSRKYRLFHQLQRDQFSQEMAATAKNLVWEEYEIDCKIEYVSVDSWREEVVNLTSL